MGAGVDGLERERVVEVDVGNHGDRQLLHDRPQRLDVLVARDGDPHEVRSGLRDLPDLRHRRLDVGGLGLGHRLDDDRRATPDLDAANVDMPLRGHERTSLERRSAPFGVRQGPIADAFTRRSILRGSLVTPLVSRTSLRSLPRTSPRSACA